MRRYDANLENVGLAGSVGLHEGGGGRIRSGPNLACLPLQFIAQNSQLSCDSQIEGMIRQESAASGQLHQIGLRGHGRTVDALAHAYQILLLRVSSSHGKFPGMVKSAFEDRHEPLGQRLRSCKQMPAPC